MKRYKLTCAYDGSRYKGWQRLGDCENTIQQKIETVIGEVVNFRVSIQGSGRTDAGVHAKGQVFDMKLPFPLQENFLIKVNQELPEDIRLLKVEEVSGAFRARYDAKSKTYEYFVCTGERPSVFETKYVYHFPYMLDVEAMRKGADYLLGKHDFTSFTDDKTEEKSKTRTIYGIHIEEQDGKIMFRYWGNGFLQHMVRIMTGTLLEIGRGDKRPEEITLILEAKNRVEAGFLVPAKGLFLKEVQYE